MRLTRIEIRERLLEQGLVFSDFSLVNTVPYTPEDAIWNYMDLAHLNPMHGMRACSTYAGKESHVFIRASRVFPCVVASCLTGPFRYTHYTTAGAFVVVAETVCEKIPAGGTKITTTYSIGSSFWFRWAHVFVAWYLKLNSRRLGAQDEPMRLRRQELRSWGYRFCEESWQNCRSTLNVARDNVFPPASEDTGERNWSLKECLPAEGEVFLGRDDHWGIRAVRRGPELLLFPRICAHEGASLDASVCEKNRIRCPWHGRVLEPIIFDLTAPNPQRKRSIFHEIVFEGNELRLRLLPGAFK